MTPEAQNDFPEHYILNKIFMKIKIFIFIKIKIIIYIFNYNVNIFMLSLFIHFNYRIVVIVTHGNHIIINSIIVWEIKH